MDKYHIVRPIQRPARLIKTAGFRFRVIGWRDNSPVVQPTNVPKRLMDSLPKLMVLDNNVMTTNEVIN